MYIPIKCKLAFNKVNSFVPYHLDMNIYRGCEHKCRYCFALYSHKYMNSTNFYNEIYVKTNIVEQLEKQITSKKWKSQVVNLGGVTDSYQPAENIFKLMPNILKLFIKYKVPVTISTKSKLILRDFNLFDELSKSVPVNVACTITSVNEKIRELIEPNASSYKERFEVLKEFSKTNVQTGIHVMPIIPELTDSYANLSSIFKTAQQCNVNYFVTDILNLRGETKVEFLNFIKDKLPHLYSKISSHYKYAYVDNVYKNKINVIVDKITDKYPLKYKKINYKTIYTCDNKQMDLF